MDISSKWISTEYRNIQFHVDIVTFEIATKAILNHFLAFLKIIQN